ncbi:MAG: M17 family peptidase N-terminal domain-containing protein, partial [Sulfurovum sp.]|nr:M17 family peptidase N-terminal domain-containing protein [Sulfurovum sp.]
MHIELTNTPIDNIKSDLKVIMVIEKDFSHSFIHDKKLLKKSGFKGDQDETMLFLEHDRLYVGVEKINSANIRTAAASAIRILLSTHYSYISIASYMNSQNCTAMLRAMTEGLILGAYRFETYKSKKRISPVKKITISL